MKSISMAYTTPAVVAKAKDVTRRTWKEAYAKSFKAGEIVDATSRQYRFGGERVAMIEVTEEPYLENIQDWFDRAEELYVKEGFKYLEATDIVPQHAPLLKLANMWIHSGGNFWVLPFKVVKVIPEMKDKYTQPEEIEKARNRLFESISGMKIKDITPEGAYIRKVA